MKLRLGILSTARIVELLLAGARSIDTVDVVAVASRERSRAEAYARSAGIPRAHGSYEQLLEDPDVDAVYVPLPNSLHVDWAIRALEAGKHVLCEKPLARRRADAERAFDAAERAGRVLAEAFMYRHHPQTARLGRLVADGAIGELRLVRGSFSFPLRDERDARLLTGLEGGSLMDVGCYPLHLARFLAGEPERVYAEQTANVEGVDVRLAATLRFADGVVAQLDSAFDQPERMHLEVVGSEGTIDVHDPWHCFEPLLEVRRDGEVEQIETERLDPYGLELEDLAAAAAGEREALLGRGDAVGQAAAIEAVYASAARQEPVSTAALAGEGTRA